MEVFFNPWDEEISIPETRPIRKSYIFKLLKRLPPGHPKAKITEAASHVREMIQNQIHMEPDQDDLEDDSEDDEEEDEHAMDLDSDMVITVAIR